MADRLQMNLMLNVAALGVLRAKKFPARREIIKQRADLDLRSRGFTAVAHNFEPAAIDHDFCSCERAGFARSQAESRHAGDAWQRFAPKSECSDCLKISCRTNLAGRMPLQRKQRIIAVHAAAVVDYSNQRNSSTANDDVNFLCTGVNAVFDQFLRH